MSHQSWETLKIQFAAVSFDAQKGNMADWLGVRIMLLGEKLEKCNLTEWPGVSVMTWLGVTER